MLLQDRASRKCLINEAYFGENSHTVKLDCIFQGVIDRITEETKGSPVKDINSMFTIAEQDEIESVLKDLFGFKKVRFTISPMANAFTLPYTLDVTSAFGMRDFKTKRGKYGQPKYTGSKPELLVHFGTGLITTGKLTARECTAVLLHEIGHNFSRTSKLVSAFDTLRFVNMLVGVSKLAKGTTANEKKEFKKAIVGLTLNMTPLKGKLIDLHRTMARAGGEEAYKNSNVMNSTFIYVKSMMSTIQHITWAMSRIGNVKMLAEAKAMIEHIINRTMTQPLGPAFGIAELVMGYRDEKFSDNFATAFGYGPEVVSMAAKLNTNLGSLQSLREPIDEHVPFLGFLVSASVLPFVFVLHSIDPHPSSLTRAKDQIRMLKKHMASADIPAETKKKIEADLAKSEKVLEDQKSSFASVNFNSSFSKTLKSTIEWYTTGGDFKEILLRTHNYDYKHLFSK